LYTLPTTCNKTKKCCFLTKRAYFVYKKVKRGKVVLCHLQNRRHPDVWYKVNVLSGKSI